MNPDDTVRQVFENSVLGITDRAPTPDEIARAVVVCVDERQKPIQRVINDVLPAVVLAAACFVASVSGQPGSGFARPLAAELVQTLPEGSGDHFVTIMVSAGDYFRSTER